MAVGRGGYGGQYVNVRDEPGGGGASGCFYYLANRKISFVDKVQIQSLSDTLAGGISLSFTKNGSMVIPDPIIVLPGTNNLESPITSYGVQGRTQAEIQAQNPSLFSNNFGTFTGGNGGGGATNNNSWRAGQGGGTRLEGSDYRAVAVENGGDGFCGTKGGNGANVMGGAAGYVLNNSIIIPLTSIFNGTGKGGDTRTINGYAGGSGAGGYGTGGRSGNASNAPEAGGFGAGGAGRGSNTTSGFEGQRGGEWIVLLYFHNDPITPDGTTLGT